MLSKTEKIKEIGRVVSFFSGIGKVEGLPHVAFHETVLDEEKNPVGIVIGFDKDLVEVLFFEENFDPKTPIFRSHEIFSIEVSKYCLGKILNGLGKPMEEREIIKGEKIPVFRKSPSIIEREPLSTPIITGIKIIDAALPLGRGQRELILGDRKLGKSTIAIDIVLNQKYASPPVYCIYVICGQKKEKLKELIETFEKYEAFSYSLVVAATAEDSFACQYLAPFVGCSIGEYFRDLGLDVLVVYDDLSKHAKIYRDISLLLERPPGREAYPGDIFSLHAMLLERAGKIKNGGSLTALPIAETEEGDISGFIPTNLISITDGQIYLERGLFQKGFLPAINVGLSVSRIGSQVQPPLLKKVTGGIRLALSQHKELQRLIQLESALSYESQKKIHRGELILELLKQEKHTFVDWKKQVALFLALEEGFLDEIKKENLKDFEKIFMEKLEYQYPEILEKIEEGKLNEEIKDKIKKVIEEIKKDFEI